jgi:hypothetical protein
MVTAADIKWGSYRQYEGPFYRGNVKFKLPFEPTANDKIMAVITATEGGHIDAWNGYDKCGWTSGLIQWCEMGQFSISSMLGKVAEFHENKISTVTRMCNEHGYVFDRDHRGRWRFEKDGDTVDTKAEQQRLFYINGDGKKGSWNDTTKQYAKRWAAAISTVWEDKIAQGLQVEYTANRLMGFALPYARKVIQAAPSGKIGSAFTAAYLSFAANNPTWANRHLKIANENTTADTYSADWLIAVLRELTFGPKITIYPHRYKAIRPALERIYGVELPDLLQELKEFQAGEGFRVVYDTQEVQEALLNLGFDLGPWGADGSWGDKTTEAFMSFEEAHGVPKEFIDGRPDKHSIPKLEEALEQRGFELLAER